MTQAYDSIRILPDTPESRFHASELLARLQVESPDLRADSPPIEASPAGTAVHMGDDGSLIALFAIAAPLVPELLRIIGEQISLSSFHVVLNIAGKDIQIAIGDIKDISKKKNKMKEIEVAIVNRRQQPHRG